MTAILVILAIIMLSLGITEGMNQRVPLNDRDNRIYHIPRLAFQWGIVIISMIAFGGHWRWVVPLLWGAAWDGAFNRVLQAVRLLYVLKQPSHFRELVTATDVDAKIKWWEFWEFKHCKWWLDWAFLFGCGIAAITLTKIIAK